MATKPVETIVTMTHEFFARASILVCKWKDRVEQYDNFHHQAVHIVPDLDPPFEGEQSKEATS
jgi:hypothetical protein